LGLLYLKVPELKCIKFYLDHPKYCKQYIKNLGVKVECVI